MLTAFFAATIACAQNDIKKVLAYSTVSQLGYMFLAVGSGAYVAAIFHMVTHAFFKALLFLGAGSVIHGMHDEQDMKRMGGLRRWMPITSATFIVGWLAIAGVPPFAGFWSKDDILANAWDRAAALWLIGLVTALLTAYYMSRQVFLVFYGDERWKKAAGSEAPDQRPPTPAQGPLPQARRRWGQAAGARGPGDFKPHESPPDHDVPAGRAGRPGRVGGLLNLPFRGSPSRALAGAACSATASTTLTVTRLAPGRLRPHHRRRSACRHRCVARSSCATRCPRRRSSPRPAAGLVSSTRSTPRSSRARDGSCPTSAPS